MWAQRISLARVEHAVDLLVVREDPALSISRTAIDQTAQKNRNVLGMSIILVERLASGSNVCFHR
jgi:hypothetical protein